MYKKIFGWLLILVITTSIVGCGSSKISNSAALGPGSMKGYNDIVTTSETGREDSNSETGDFTASPADISTSASNEPKTNVTNVQGLVNSANVSQKLIFTGQVNFETLDFDKTRTNLYNYITSIGGFSQNSSVKGGRIGYEGLRSAEYTFRIPKAKFHEAIIDLRKFGTVVLEQSNGEDVSDRYSDTEARLKSLKIQQERLQALLQKAVKMEDILKIESELQKTLYEIENYTGTIKKWDSLIEYSTLNVNIREVEQIKPVTPKEKDGFFSRIAFGFKNSVIDLWEFLQNFIVFLAAALPVFIPFGLIGYLLYRVIRKKIKKSKTDE